MKRITITFLSFLTLTGCFLEEKWPVEEHPLHIRNTYYKKLYINEFSTNTFGDELSTCSNWLEKYPLRTFETKQSSNFPALKKIEFYYSDCKCLLFSYTLEDLLKLKEKFGFKKDDLDVIYLLEKNSLRVVSNKKYESIKHTFKLQNPPRSEVCK